MIEGQIMEWTRRCCSWSSSSKVYDLTQSIFQLNITNFFYFTSVWEIWFNVDLSILYADDTFENRNVAWWRALRVKLIGLQKRLMNERCHVPTKRLTDWRTDKPINTAPFGQKIFMSNIHDKRKQPGPKASSEWLGRSYFVDWKGSVGKVYRE